MNRLIKFRAWHKNNKEMIEIFNSECQTEWYLPNLNEKYEVMQYTGLVDIHEKAIYEGDIVIYVDDSHVKRKGEVIFKNTK